MEDARPGGASVTRGVGGGGTLRVMTLGVEPSGAWAPGHATRRKELRRRLPIHPGGGGQTPARTGSCIQQVTRQGSLHRVARASPHPSPIRDFEFTLLVLDADWVAIPVVGRSALRSKGVRTVPGAFVAGSPGHIDLDCERRACADLGVAPVFGQCGTEVVKLSGLTP